MTQIPLIPGLVMVVPLVNINTAQADFVIADAVTAPADRFPAMAARDGNPEAFDERPNRSLLAHFRWYHLGQ